MITHTKQIDVENSDIESGFLEFFYIELPKFTKKLKECKNELEQWVYVMKNLGLLRDAPKDLRVNTTWQEFFELANVPKEASTEYKSYLKELQTGVEKKSVELAKIDDLTEELDQSKEKIKQAEEVAKKAEEDKIKAEEKIIKSIKRRLERGDLISDIAEDMDLSESEILDLKNQ